MTLQEYKAQVLEDGKVDADEVVKLRELIYEDGKVDKEEADTLFEINNAVSGKDNAPEWQQLFVDGISAFVLEDETSPGVVDADESAYLKEQIHGDGQVDDAEKALLTNLKAKATGDIPADLQFLFDMYLK